MRNPKSFEARRDAAMERDDLTWAAKMLPNASSPRVVEMAFHKARLETLSVSDAKRRASLQWLRERGLTRLSGEPLPDDIPRDEDAPCRAQEGG
jgi:hypothetical protein